MVQQMTALANSNQSRCLLIVDDEPHYANSLENLLVAEGYTVKKALDLQLAEEILRENSIDLALIDNRLGGSSGIDFVSECQRIRPELACVIITGHASIETATEAFRSGAHDFLQKSINIDELLIALERSYQRIKLTKERTATELKLEESNERFRSSFEYTSIGMVLTDLDGRFKQANKAIGKLLGYSAAELLDLNYVDITHPEEVENIILNQQKINSGEVDSCRMANRFLHKSGHYLWTDTNITLVRKTDKNPAYNIVHIVDISKEKKYSEELSYLASHDNLTKLINRREFESRISRILESADLGVSEHIVGFVDLDRFKVVNDTCGHAAGDEMLRQISEIMRRKIRTRDTIARLGGDEFGLLMEHCSITNALRATNSLLNALQQFQFSWEQRRFNIGASIGLVTISEGDNVTGILKAADAACYKAKELGRNRVHIYETDDVDLIKHQNEIEWISQIHRALDEDRFCLYAQIISPLNDSNIRHYEVLVRLKNEAGEIILPGDFLPTAEHYNLITSIDRRVIEMAFALLAENPVFNRQIEFISINLSGQSIADSEFLEFLITQFSISQIDGNKICFEITETAAISNLSMAIKFMETLKELGCHFALDDFGSGLSSFAYLKNLPVDYLKIDGIFVKDLVDNAIDYAMVKSINEIGQVMGMQTIAEYVENDEIKNKLRLLGVNYVQGFGIGKPQPLNDLLNKTAKVAAIEDAGSADRKS
jgi:diguanylate cyclase (GGDEF)-like protein/PAS domain S-box-containing protein